MKKLILAFVLSLVSIAASAQNISYATMMKLYAMSDDLEAVDNTLESWGYTIGEVERDDEYECDRFTWGWGTARYDESIEDWVTTGTRHAIFAYSYYDDGSGIMRFSFPSSTTYNQVKSQLQANGWRLDEEETTETGYCKTYRKSSHNGYVTLRQYTIGNGGYGFSLVWY